ncbi:MAG: histidine--tRNA ligase [Candidatus Saccharibacteria bacterium]|nr:histidine--tRNA ligase [Candidatus Saccharibacteria bacterium]
MKKINTSPISGTQELLPETQVLFDKLKTGVAERYRAHGFLNIETPMLERTEVLLAKVGGDTEKQIYKVAKTNETMEDATEALRFDHTVPLARYIVEHESDLTFPLKVSQMGENFRGERAQRGRFREFYQCDVDIIARNELPLFYDADVISTLLDAFSSFGLKTPVLARISNRKILKGLIEGLNLQEKAADIYSIIDHSEKVPAEKTAAAFDEIGLNPDEKAKILEFMEISGEAAAVAEKIKALGVKNSLMDEGLSELTGVAENLTAGGYDNFIADMRIVRGLDYYTGTVFEFILPEYKDIGSVCGGGRYENLAEYFTDQKFPGVGGSIGLNRLFFVLNEKKLLKDVEEKPVDYAVVPISDKENAYAVKMANEMREKGATVTVVAGDKKLGDKMKYASKLAKNAIVIGDAEVASGKYRIKEFN